MKTYNTIESNILSHTTNTDTIRKVKINTPKFHTMNSETERETNNKKSSSLGRKKVNAIEINRLEKLNVNLEAVKPNGHFLQAILKNSRNSLRFDLMKPAPLLRTTDHIDKNEGRGSLNHRNTFEAEANKKTLPLSPLNTKSRINTFRTAFNTIVGKESVKTQEPEQQKETNSTSRSTQSGSKPMFKNCIAMNKFLIRDFLIGTAVDPTKSSKKKYSMTTHMFEFIDKNKKNRIKNIRQAFEIEKYGAIILEEDPPQKDNIIDFTSENFMQYNEQEKIKFAMKRLDERRMVILTIVIIYHFFNFRKI
jgi:hypothetical protein